MLHALITLLFAAAGSLCGFPGIALLAAAFYVGREHAQAEYRYIEAHGGTRADCPWYCGFLPSAWTIKGLLDWVLPVVAAVGMMVVCGEGII